MKKLFFLLVCNLTIFSASAQISFLDKKLFELPDVIFSQMETPEGFQSAYELLVKQPIDHNSPEKGYFYQRAFLSHRGFDKPVVFVTEGYEQPGIRSNELTNLLDANQIEVEHRFFGESVPYNRNFLYLTAEQEAGDLHHINQLFKEIYIGKWISTGISKGGQNSIIYRYFYPSDVDVTVPYVAPINLSTSDERIYKFFDTVSTSECRNMIRDFQIRILKERDKVIPLLRWYAMGKGLQFTYLSFEEAFEYTVLEYSFSFWQWGHTCDEIPSPNSSIEKDVLHLLDVSDIEFFSDKVMKKYESHYYQAAGDVGYYSYRTDDFKGLLKALPMKPYPSAIFTPEKIKVYYNSSVSKKVYDWTQSSGNNMLYIYGAADTWSATSVPPSAKTNSQWFFIAGANHGTARISYMSPTQKALFISKLEEWLQIKINN